MPVQHVIPGSHQDLYKWERKYLEFSEVDIKKLNVGSYKDMDLARAGEELDTANDPVKTNASNYY